MFRKSEPQTLKELSGKRVHEHEVCILLLKLNKEYKKFCGLRWLSSRNEGKASQSLPKVTVVAGGTNRNFPAYFTNT